MCNNVFGYGSLVDLDALESQLNRPIPQNEWSLCNLNGYIRKWNIAMENLIDIPGYKFYEDASTGIRPEIFITYLNIVPVENAFVNGIVFRVMKDELEILDRREHNYERLDVSNMIDGEFDGKVFTYAGTPEAEARFAKGFHLGKAVVDASYEETVKLAFLTHDSTQLDAYEATTHPHNLPKMHLNLCRVSQ